MGAPSVKTTDARRSVALFLLLLIVIAGGFLRFYGLGERSFSGDEALHVFAARGLVDHGRPEFPSGQPYTRALLVTHLIRWSFDVVGEGSAAARLPSAVAGTIAVAIAYLLGASLFGRTAGVVAAALQAVTPDAVSMSRFARSYALAQLLVMVTAWGAFLALEGRTAHATLRRAARIAAGALALGALLLTARLQTEAYALAVPLGLYVATMSAWAVWRSGVTALLASVYGRALIGGLALVLLVVAVAPDRIVALWSQVRTPLPWVDPGSFSVKAYHYYLSDNYGWLWVAAPAATLAGLVTSFTPAFYATVLFWVPLTALSTLVPTQTSHHLFVFVPFLFILEAEGARLLTTRVWEEVGMRPANADGLNRRTWLRWGLVAAAWTGTIVLSPWLAASLKTPFLPSGELPGAHFDSWRETGEDLRANATGAHAVIANSDLLALYYVGRVDARLLVRTQRPHSGDRDIVQTQHGWRYVTRTTGAPALSELEDLIEAVSGHPRGWIVLERWRLAGERDHFAPGVRRFLERCLERRRTRGEPSIVVFEWDASYDLRGCATRVAASGA